MRSFAPGTCPRGSPDVRTDGGPEVESDRQTPSGRATRKGNNRNETKRNETETKLKLLNVLPPSPLVRGDVPRTPTFGIGSPCHRRGWGLRPPEPPVGDRGPRGPGRLAQPVVTV